MLTFTGKPRADMYRRLFFIWVHGMLWIDLVLEWPPRTPGESCSTYVAGFSSL